MTSLFWKMQWWLQRRRREAELQEELRFHLAEEMDERRVHRPRGVPSPRIVPVPDDPNDPGAVALAAAILLTSALAAGYGPACRASRVDPLTALRHE